MVEFLGHAASKGFDGGRHLFVLDSVVFVVFVFALEALPGQAALLEVEEDEADGLEVVTTALLNAQVCVH